MLTFDGYLAFAATVDIIFVITWSFLRDVAAVSPSPGPERLSTATTDAEAHTRASSCCCVSCSSH